MAVTGLRHGCVVGGGVLRSESRYEVKYERGEGELDHHVDAGGEEREMEIEVVL